MGEHDFDDDDSLTEKTIVRPEITRTLTKSDSPACLVFWLPKSRRGEQVILDRPITIGRSSSCDVFVEDASMSKRHAQIMVDPHSIYIKDLNSTNKTYLDRDRVEPERLYELKANCTIRMASTVFMYYKPGSIEVHQLNTMFKDAYLDPLTECLNKRALMERAPELLDKARSNQQSLCLIVFDLDHFKKVNDGYGHAAGDFVLKELSQLVQNDVIRVEDLFSRYGGEEFVAVLSNVGIAKATEIAERLRMTIEKHSFILDQTRLPVTVSVGVSQFNAQSDSWEMLFERADQASYDSKKAGRNRVSVR